MSDEFKLQSYNNINTRVRNDRLIANVMLNYSDDLFYLLVKAGFIQFEYNSNDFNQQNLTNSFSHNAKNDTYVYLNQSIYNYIKKPNEISNKISNKILNKILNKNVLSFLKAYVCNKNNKNNKKKQEAYVFCNQGREIEPIVYDITSTFKYLCISPHFMTTLFTKKQTEFDNNTMYSFVFNKMSTGDSLLNLYNADYHQTMLNQTYNTTANDIVVQLLYSISCLNYYGIIHADLLPQNIQIKKRTNEKKYIFILSNDFYITISTNVDIIVFDFDKSYLVDINKNISCKNLNYLQKFITTPSAKYIKNIENIKNNSPHNIHAHKLDLQYLSYILNNMGYDRSVIPLDFGDRNIYIHDDTSVYDILMKSNHNRHKDLSGIQLDENTEIYIHPMANVIHVKEIVCNLETWISKSTTQQFKICAQFVENKDIATYLQDFNLAGGKQNIIYKKKKSKKKKSKKKISKKKIFKKKISKKKKSKKKISKKKKSKKKKSKKKKSKKKN
jgi:hypothetical protein